MADQNDILTPDVRFHLIRKMERHKVIALAAPVLLPHEAKYLEFHRVAGVILFQRNVESLSQVSELIGSVTELLVEGELPPLVLADHEGDFVAELKKIIGVPPSPMAIAATGDPGLARDVARETGLVMKKLGVNVVLAPVADCCFDLASPITGLRTFGNNLEMVSEMVASTIAGFRDADMLSCAKHFPGHGSTPDDSHETLPEVEKSLNDLRREDLIPFRRAIVENVDMIMVSHVAFPMGKTSLVPASFDGRIMKDLLRDEMGFRGVIITDSLEMAGARWYARGQRGEFAGGFERSLLAGSDLLLHTNPVPESVEIEGGSEPVMSLKVMETIIRTLERVVDRNRIDEKITEAAEKSEPLRNLLSLLDQSQLRINVLRDKLLRCATPARSAPRHSKVIQFDAYPSVPSVYRKVAERSIANWGDETQLRPIPLDQPCVVMPVEWSPNMSLKKHDLEGFVEVLCKNFARWEQTSVVTGFEQGSDGEMQPEMHGGPQVIDVTRYSGAGTASEFVLPGDSEFVIVFSARGKPDESFLAGLQSIAERFEPAAVLVIGWPITKWIPPSVPALLCFGASSQVASAAAEILNGAAPARGKTDGLFPE